MAMSGTVVHSVVAVYFLTGFTVSAKYDGDYSFPEGFKIGAAAASYQIEGGWNASDKGENVWDRFTHTKPWLVADKSNGDVACDSYHKYKEDVEWLKNIGFDHYRLSLSWSRILPTGYANKVSKDGIKYYKDLLDELNAAKIEPLVNLYHWDHPQILEDQGGWTNDMMVDWFSDYARVVFRELGSRIKMFATINEPNSFCFEGYETEKKAPGKLIYQTGSYLCGHNVLKAHARAYHIYDREFRAKQNGVIGIVLPCAGQIAKFPGDEVSVDTDFQFGCGWFGHPIFSAAGDYPEVMRRKIAANSKAEGWPRSRLPVFSKKWIDYIRGTADFFGLNHYTTYQVEPASQPVEDDDSGLVISFDPSWPRSASDWLRVTPFGFGDILRRIKKEYNNPIVYVTENGFSDTGTRHDQERIDYYDAYLKEMLVAIKRDGCDVRRFTAWALMDNFEWNRGYTEKFGIIHVDFDSPNRTRSAKLSVSWWKNVLSTRTLNDTIAKDQDPAVVLV